MNDSITSNNLVGSLFKLVRLLLRFLAGALGLLAGSAKTSDTNEATDNAVRGGVLNYRTGKLDDGTDPTGWYEQD